MSKRSSITRWRGNYVSPKKISKPHGFFIDRKNKTSISSPVFNLLDYQVESFDMDQIRMAIIRARQDYGKAFKRLAAED